MKRNRLPCFTECNRPLTVNLGYKRACLLSVPCLAYTGLYGHRVSTRSICTRAHVLLFGNSIPPPPTRVLPDSSSATFLERKRERKLTSAYFPVENDGRRATRSQPNVLYHPRKNIYNNHKTPAARSQQWK